MTELDETRHFRAWASQPPTDAVERARKQLFEEMRKQRRGNTGRHLPARFAAVGAMALACITALVTLTPTGAALADHIGELLGAERTAPGFVESASDRQLQMLNEALERSAEVGDLPFGAREASRLALAPEDRGDFRSGEVDLGNGGSATVVVNAQMVCLTTRREGDAATGCGTVADALKGRVFTVTSCVSGVPNGQVQVTGMIRDGVEKLTAQGGGSVTTIAVNKNVFQANLPPARTRFTADLPGRSWSVPLDRMGLRPGESCLR